MSWMWAAVGAMLAWTGWALALRAGVTRVGPLHATLISLVAELTTLISLISCAGTGWMGGGRTWESSSVTGLAYSTLAGLLGMTGLLLFSVSLKSGSVAVATAVTSAYPAVVAVVSILVLGERLSPLSSIGVILAITGMILIGLEARQ
jgi:uncharacterized membrane protein